MTSHARLAANSLGLVLGLLLSPALACTTTNTASGSGTDAGLSSDGDGGVGTDTGPLTCFGIFQCAAACTGDGCEDACAARGSDEAKTATANVVTCYQANACDGGDCLESKCKAEVDACAALQDPGGKPVDTVPPASAPPAEIVGKWHSYYAPNAQTEDWTFNADGTAAHYSGVAANMSSGCQWGGIVDSTGTVVFEGSEKLTYYQTGGTSQQSTCGRLGAKEPAPMKAYTYAWAIDATTGKLLIVDQNLQSCIAQPGYQTCRTTLDRQ